MSTMEVTADNLQDVADWINSVGTDYNGNNAVVLPGTGVLWKTWYWADGGPDIGLIYSIGLAGFALPGETYTMDEYGNVRVVPPSPPADNPEPPSAP
ncbi:hypothetical protein AB0M47_33230 [Hamadaea sp. NPDC051192]|uniref:hypothetical protein n=1 Tax=Hamadaea sp. NPDC051192 TaxID=3154940 RepID=UPI0034209EF8